MLSESEPDLEISEMTGIRRSSERARLAPEEEPVIICLIYCLESSSTETIGLVKLISEIVMVEELEEPSEI